MHRGEMDRIIARFDGAIQLLDEPRRAPVLAEETLFLYLLEGRAGLKKGETLFHMEEGDFLTINPEEICGWHVYHAVDSYDEKGRSGLRLSEDCNLVCIYLTADVTVKGENLSRKSCDCQSQGNCRDKEGGKWAKHPGILQTNSLQSKFALCLRILVLSHVQSDRTGGYCFLLFICSA